MAGRGTDIKLGGAEDSENLEKEMKVSKDSGGLYIIGTERHESRRIDNQLRGRSRDKVILDHQNFSIFRG